METNTIECAEATIEVCDPTEGGIDFKGIAFSSYVP